MNNTAKEIDISRVRNVLLSKLESLKSDENSELTPYECEFIKNSLLDVDRILRENRYWVPSISTSIDGGNKCIIFSCVIGGAHAELIISEDTWKNQPQEQLVKYICTFFAERAFAAKIESDVNAQYEIMMKNYKLMGNLIWTEHVKAL